MMAFRASRTTAAAAGRTTDTAAVVAALWLNSTAAAPPALLCQQRRGFASKNPFGRSGAAKADSPWGSSSGSNAKPAARPAATHKPPPPQRPAPAASAASSSSGGARGSWASARDSKSSAGSGSSGGGKKNYSPRNLGAAAAAANPRPNRPSGSADAARGVGGPVWAPVAAKFAEASSSSSAKKTWTRGGGKATTAAAAAAPAASAPSAAELAWGRSAQRRERLHGAPLPSLGTPIVTVIPPAPSASSQRGGYRHGGERDARSKTRERFTPTPAAAAPAATPSSSFNAASSASFSSYYSADASAADARPRRSFAEKAEAEEDVRETVENTASTREFWTHFPMAKRMNPSGSGTTAATAPIDMDQALQRKTNLEQQMQRAMQPQQGASSSSQQSSQSSNFNRSDEQQQGIKKPYTPVFINRPTAAPASSASATASTRPTAATSSSIPSSSPSAMINPRHSAPMPKPKVRGAEQAELMGSSLPSVSLNRSTIRVGVLIPADQDEVDEHDLHEDPSAPSSTPSTATATTTAAQQRAQRLRARIEAMSQDLASATGAELVTHPLHVDLCAEFVPMAQEETMEQEEEQEEEAAEGLEGEGDNENAEASAELKPKRVRRSNKPLASGYRLPVLHLFESSVRHAPNSLRGRARVDPETGMRGMTFYPSFYDYFSHTASRVMRDASEAKLIAKNALIRAVKWKPEGTPASAATNDAEADDDASPSAAATPATPAKPTSRRMRLRNVNQLAQPLAGITVMDATAGFAVDTFTLAMLGARVAAYENYPLFSTLLRQAQRMVRREDTHLSFIQQRVSMHFKDSVQTMKEWAAYAQEQKDNPAPAAADADAPTTDAAASTISSDSTSTRPRFPLPSPPDVVYLDLYASGQGGLIGTAALPFRIQVRSRYLKMLCEVPEPRVVDQALEAALALARSHVVMKFPMQGTHYRPGDAKPEDDAAEATTTPRVPWRVARIFKHKHLKSEFVVYQRINSNDEQQAAVGEQ